MTLDLSNDTFTETARRGRTFTYSGGRGVLVCPDPQDPTCWLIHHPATNVLSIAELGEVIWRNESVTDDELVQALATAWQTECHARTVADERLAEKVQLVEDVRQYAIERFLDGSICRDGLNNALAHFNAEPYEPRYRVPLMVNAVIEINADDSDEAARRVRYLIDGLAVSGESGHEDVYTQLGSIEIGDVEEL